MSEGPDQSRETSAGTDIVSLTGEELALRWRISPRTLERWRRQRKGPPWLRVGGRVLYRLEDVRAYEAAHTTWL